MTNLSIDIAEKNLKSLINQTITDNDCISISTENGSVVMVTEKEWNSIQETFLLLKDKKSLAALLEGHQARKENIPLAFVSPDTAFYDIQD